jgi:type II secretory pathway component PulK
MTPEEADQLSQRRAKRNQTRLIVVAVFVVLAFLTLASLLQRQQTELESFVQKQCEQRRTNAIRTNATWDRLALLDSQNPQIPYELKQQRIRSYAEAKLDLPDCDALH